MSILSKLLTQSSNGHKLSTKRALVLSSSLVSLAIWLINLIHIRTKSSLISGNNGIAYTDKTKTKTKMESMSKLLSHLKTILKKLLGAKEYVYVMGIATTLVVRTMCDLWLIQNGTQIEAAIITADISKLKSNLGDFIISMPIFALVNNTLKYCINELKLNLRYRLSLMLYNKYTNGLTYYRLNVLDNECQNIDQLLTNDVEKFCNTIVDVYSNVSKPVLDIVILIHRLSSVYTGISTPGAMVAYLLVAGPILVNARRPMAKLTVQETLLEGQLRYVHNKIISNCEEIAFYQGHNRERQTLVDALNRLRNHLSKMSRFKFLIDFVDNILTRYLATVCGYLALSIPFLTGRYGSHSQSVRLETYYKSGRMMVKLAESIGRLVMAGRDFTRLAAYTTRVNQLINTIENVPNNALKSITSEKMSRPLIAGSGVVQVCDPKNPIVEFRDVPLCTPNGELLVQSINFTLRMGQNVIITGPNGSGKSSLFRLLGELWPLFGGRLIKPRNSQLFYIPQRPYMTLGTFRDQIIYPDSIEDMHRKAITDDHLLEFLRIVQIEYLVERESLDSVQDWHDVLSGGEKQRIALARLLYHKPLFAILDECTSAVSIDVEQSIYEYLTNSVQCSLLSVTHRVKQLQQYHHFVLDYDKLMITAFRTIGLIVIYYIFSIGITFYQKWFIKKFHYPLSVVTCHMIVKLVIAYTLRLIYKSITGMSRISLSWDENVRKLSATGIASALDIGFSNWSFEFITISLYTMTKSSCIVFILLFAILFDLEKKRFSLIIVVSLISSGLFMFTYQSTQFQIQGFLLVLSASLLGGLRWTLSQLVMQRKEVGMKSIAF
ncbi:unnamed protein product, partial [Medioppia subpectinata]